VDDEARRISRRRALALGGPLGLGASLALAGCELAADPTVRPPERHDPLATAAVALLAKAGTCRLTPQRAQGPYWFDVDSIRGDLREDRPGVPLRLALRVQDVSRCPGRPLRDVVVEVWHCDAGGVYSGFRARTPIPAGQQPLGWPNNRGGEMPAGDPTADPMGYTGTTSHGGYSFGDAEAPSSGDGTFLRGAQATDARGIAQFTTVYPGWYAGRTPHVHLKAHLNRTTILATQLFFDDAVTDRIYPSPPYSEHPGRDTRNATDAMFTPAGLLTLRRHGDAYLAATNLGVNHPILPPGAAGNAV
jgi:protocatechuate 3,4-dioxygenase beta subunit